MYRVQLRDANQPDKVLVETFNMPFDPQDGSELRVRRRARDERRVTHYRVVKHYIYEAVIDDPHEGGMALLVTELPQ